MTRCSAAGLVVVWVMLSATISRGADAPIAGKFSDGQLTVELSQATGNCSGSFTLGSQQFPATANINGNNLYGSFKSGDNSFPFTATLADDTLTLSTGGKTYTLKRQTTAANPLAAPQPANPLTQSDPLAGYTVVVANDAGKSLVTQKAGATSIQTALEATFPDLAKYFGERPAIGRAYQDAQNPKSGGATFTAHLGGNEVKGIVSCKLNDGGGATVAVMYGRSDASKADWDKLMAPSSSSPGDAAADDSAKLLGPDATVYQFPDGTGSITLATGWKTNSQTAIHAVVISGPADQQVIVGNSFGVQTPDSPTVKMMQQNQAMMQQMQARNQRMGFKSSPPPPPPPPIFIAPYSDDPVQALKNLVPQFSKRGEANHGPSLRLDQIISSKDVPTNLPNAKCSIITYTATRTLNGNTSHYRTTVRLQVNPMSPTMWLWQASSVTAPEATFSQDAPVMFAMYKSFKINADRAQQVANAENQQMQQMTQQMAQQSQQQLEANARQFQENQQTQQNIYQQQHDAQMEGYAQHNQQWQSDELQKQRNAADFIETIKGTRTVYDTQTGASTAVDLSSVSGVVNQLNQDALDPNRFVQIPLRDEMYPVPPVGAGK